MSMCVQFAYIHGFSACFTAAKVIGQLSVMDVVYWLEKSLLLVCACVCACSHAHTLPFCALPFRLASWR